MVRRQNRSRRPNRPHIPAGDVLLDKGAELGRFNMGSTVILLFQPGRARLSAALAAGASVRVGECLGELA